MTFQYVRRAFRDIKETFWTVNYRFGILKYQELIKNIFLYCFHRVFFTLLSFTTSVTPLHTTTRKATRLQLTTKQYHDSVHK
jgi:hypothetical protein